MVVFESVYNLYFRKLLLLGAVSIILFIPTTKNFQSQKIHDEPTSNRAKKRTVKTMETDFGNTVIGKLSSESPSNSLEEKILSSVEDQFPYYLDDQVINSREEPMKNSVPRILDSDSTGSFKTSFQSFRTLWTPYCIFKTYIK